MYLNVAGFECELVFLHPCSSHADLEGDVGAEEAPVELHPPQSRFDLVQDLERLMVVRLFELLVGLRHELEDRLELLVLGLDLLVVGIATQRRLVEFNRLHERGGNFRD